MKTWYYAERPDGYLCDHGGPGTLYRFESREERDEFVRTVNLAAPVARTHHWVKQAYWWAKVHEYKPNWRQAELIRSDHDYVAAAH